MPDKLKIDEPALYKACEFLMSDKGKKAVKEAIEMNRTNKVLKQIISEIKWNSEWARGHDWSNIYLQGIRDAIEIIESYAKDSSDV